MDGQSVKTPSAPAASGTAEGTAGAAGGAQGAEAPRQADGGGAVRRQAGSGRRSGRRPARKQPASDGPGAPQAAAGPQAAPAGTAGNGAAAGRDADSGPAPGGPADDADDAAPQPHMRVDARALESALINLKTRIAALPLLFEAPGAAEATAIRAKLLSQIDDYLLPRLRRSAAPVLVALVGSTGAGKSTLINSIVGRQVSATGIRRPTTNSPVLACHPEDAGWFAENNFLPTLPRVRQEGLARPGRDGLLVLAAAEGTPKGVALLDTPDIDSVVEAHHAFAYQFLDASDLWLLVTSASRYADATVWQMLQHARDRGASLGIVLSRVPPGSRSELVDHFTAMLESNGVGRADCFVVPETRVTDGMLPPDVSEPVRAWLAEVATREDRRVAVLTQTMSGVLGTFRTLVPALAAYAEAQLGLRSDLRSKAAGPYLAAAEAIDEAAGDGSLFRGEVLVRWQDFVVTGDLVRGPRSRRATRQGKRARGQHEPERAAAVNAALRSALTSLITSAADRAAEDADSRWRADPAGAALLAAAARRRATGRRAEAAAFAPAYGSGQEARAATGAAGAGGASEPPDSTAIARSSPDLPLRAARAVSAWHDHVMRLVTETSRAKRSIIRRVPLDDESLGLLMVLTILGERALSKIPGWGAAPGGDAGRAAEGGGVPAGADDIMSLPRRTLTVLFGEEAVREISEKARAELRERVRLLLDEELLRFSEIIDGAGPCDEVASIRLYQAEYSLEAIL